MKQGEIDLFRLSLLGIAAVGGMMAGAVRDHVKSAYTASWQVAAEIDAGTITSEAEIDQHTAWPR